MPDWWILLQLQAIALEVFHRQRYGSCNSSQAIAQVARGGQGWGLRLGG